MGSHRRNVGHAGSDGAQLCRWVEKVSVNCRFQSGETMAKKVLNPKQEAFVNAYVSGGCKNGTQAAIDAGYAAKTARVTASKLLTLANIKNAIEARRQPAKEAAIVDAAFVFSKLKETVLVNSHLIQKEGFEGPMFNADGSPVMRQVDAQATVSALKTLASCLQMGKEKGDKDSTIASLAETLRGLIDGPKRV